MRIRAIDGNSDFMFGKGRSSYKDNAEAIGENIQTRLISFLSDCFFDAEFGINWFYLLGQKNGEKELILACKNMILQSYGVVKVNSISWIEDSNRQLSLKFDIDTIFTASYIGVIGVPA